MKEKEKVTIQKILANNVSRLRKQAGMSVDDFADKIGVSSSELAAMEDGKTVIPLERLMKIARTLGLATKEIVDATEQFASRFEESGNFAVDREPPQPKTADLPQPEKSGDTAALVSMLVVGAIIGYLISKK